VGPHGRDALERQRARRVALLPDVEYPMRVITQLLGIPREDEDKMAGRGQGNEVRAALLNDEGAPHRWLRSVSGSVVRPGGARDADDRRVSEPEPQPEGPRDDPDGAADPTWWSGLVPCFDGGAGKRPGGVPGLRRRM
jgi:hypothetical protein